MVLLYIYTYIYMCMIQNSLMIIVIYENFLALKLKNIENMSNKVYQGKNKLSTCFYYNLLHNSG